MKLNKKQLIDTLLGQVDSHIATVQHHYLTAKPGILLKPAPDGGWSIAQCLDHLNGYGEYYLPLLEAAALTMQRHEDVWYRSGWLGDYFTRMMAPETGTRKYKAFKGHIPVAELDAVAVVNEFLRQQERLKLVLTKSYQLDMAKARIPISISRWIKLSMGDTLRFIIAHNCRHIQQAERNFCSQLPAAA